MKDLFVSRKFWAALLLIVVTIIASFSPGFTLDSEHGAGFVVIIASYIIGVAVDPGPGGWRGVLQSRKFWGAVVGLIILFLDAFHLVLPFGMTGEQIISIAVAIGVYISGIAIEGRIQPLQLPINAPSERSDK